MKKRGIWLRRVLWWAALGAFIASGIWIALYAYSAYQGEQTIAAMSGELAGYRASQRAAATLPTVEPATRASQGTYPTTESLATYRPSTVEQGDTVAVSPAPFAAEIAATTGEQTEVRPTPTPTALITAKAIAATTAHTQTVAPTATEDPVLAVYRTFATQNKDMVGWVSIDGTVVDYPVMYTPGDPQRYLHRDFQGQYSFSGLPFLDARSDLENPMQNRILYAHNMRSGLMFAALHQYLDPTFLAEHPMVRFDTLSQTAVYEVFAVLQVNLASMESRSMRCYSMFDTASRKDVAAMNEYLTRYAKYQLAEIKPNDAILTLSTCQHLGSIDRLVVMARRANDEAAQQPTAANTPGELPTQTPR